MRRISILFAVSCLPVLSPFLYAESRHEIYTEKEVSFLIADHQIVTLSLGNFDGGEGVITSPDTALTGLPFNIGAMKYGYGQPFVFHRDRLSQAALIPYGVGGGTGVAEYAWCVVTAEQEHVYIQEMGTWHYHCAGPEDHFFSFDLLPSFYTAYKHDLCLSFIFEERNDEYTRFIRGKIVMDITLSGPKMGISLRPCGIEDALSLADLLATDGPVQEWTLNCLKQVFPIIVKDVELSDDPVSPAVIRQLKKAIKKEFDRRD